MHQQTENRAACSTTSRALSKAMINDQVIQLSSLTGLKSYIRSPKLSNPTPYHFHLTISIQPFIILYQVISFSIFSTSLCSSLHHLADELIHHPRHLLRRARCDGRGHRLRQGRQRQRCTTHGAHRAHGRRRWRHCCSSSGHREHGAEEWSGKSA